MFKKIDQQLLILSIQLTLIYLWLLAAWPKLTSASYIEGFNTKFGQTFLGALPGGITLQVYFLGALELVAGLLAILSLVKLEFKTLSFIWLQRCLAVSAFTFTVLGFGLRIIQDYSGSANIFFYLSGTVVLYIFTLHLRSSNI